MTETDNIIIDKTEHSRIHEVDFNNIIFGRQFSDHMLTAECIDGVWGPVKIEPYQNLSLSPAACVIHYGQSIFEGMKAYKNGTGEVMLFRPHDNWRRLNESAERMCMETVPEEVFIEGLYELLKLDRAWVPDVEGASLYIRPFLFATEEFLGVKPSTIYKFMIITCPVGPYYTEPVSVKIERYFTRAAEGGVGQAKAAGNYAASLFPAKEAQKEGFHQLVWTDAKTHEYIEESGTMNIFFQIGSKIITPSTERGTILKGITRDSVIQLAREWGITVEERPVKVNEILDALKAGALKDMFGTGTAATIAQVKSFSCDGEDFTLPPVEERDFSNRVASHLQDLKRGRAEDSFGWIETV